jgi:hypothetical protein
MRRTRFSQGRDVCPADRDKRHHDGARRMAGAANDPGMAMASSLFWGKRTSYADRAVP